MHPLTGRVGAIMPKGVGMKIRTKTIMTITASPGDAIGDFINKVSDLFVDNDVECCVLEFNSWSYLLYKSYRPVTNQYIVGNYYKYINGDEGVKM